VCDVFLNKSVARLFRNHFIFLTRKNKMLKSVKLEFNVMK